MTDLALAPSTNASLGNYLASFEDQSERAARQNLQAWLETAGTSMASYTQPELRAMVKLEQLKLIGDLSLAEVLLRGKVIQQIENEGLWNIHPERYGSMQEAAKANGISVSEYSNIRDLYNTVFPFLVETLGMNLAEVWEEVGKSNFRELCPYLVRLITGEPSQSRNVEASIANLLDDIAATNEASEVEMTEDQIRLEAVSQLMEAGQLPNRQLRERIRPERTPSFQSLVLDYNHNGQAVKVVVSLVDADQFSMFQRRLNGYMDVTPVDPTTLANTPFGQMLREAA